MVVNTVTVARVCDRSVCERKSYVLLVVPTASLKRSCLEDIACRRHVIRWLPDPLGGLPVVCRVASDDMSNSRERKMIAHHRDPIGRDAVENGLARLDRLRGVVVEDRRPVGVLQTRHRVMGMSPICMNCWFPEVNRIVAWDGECPGAAT
jgi:hypothetical protein